MHFIFEIYDKIIKLDTKLYNLSFIIYNRDKKKTFEIFYTRFNIIIASLNYLDILKIFNLKRLISIRLRYRISSKSFIIFAELIIYLCYVVANLKVIDKVNFKENKIESN